jgi:hypothetical protein
LERQEKKLVGDIKKSAKDNQMVKYISILYRYIYIKFMLFYE